MIKWQYPEAASENPDAMLHNVATFCFPDATALAQKGKDIIKKYAVSSSSSQAWVGSNLPGAAGRTAFPSC